MTWKELARENRTTACELFEANRWRSAASRAYYAIYARVTDVLLSAGATMPSGRSNPKHKTLPELVGNNLSAISLSKRWRLAGLIKQLYDFRIIADYRPAVTLDGDDARICFAVMNQAFLCLKEVP